MEAAQVVAQGASGTTSHLDSKMRLSFELGDERVAREAGAHAGHEERCDERAEVESDARTRTRST